MPRNFEKELHKADWIIDKIQESDIYAQNLYAALCNNDLYPIDNLFDIIRQDVWHCSWRYAAGMIAGYREDEDYIDWYCSGMFDTEGFVPESIVTDEIQADVRKMGWKITDK